MFSVELVKPVRIEQINAKPFRRYKTPSGALYPSVTSVLSYHPGGNAELEKWRQAVGTSEADLIGKRATMRGTAIHAYAENYILNKPFAPLLVDRQIWAGMKSVIDKSFGQIIALETPLYSDTLKMAGTVDCVGYFEGVLSIIDFKTAGRLKHKEEIDSYFIQTTAYALMFQELYFTKIKQLVIIIANDESNHPLVYTERTSNWVTKLAIQRKAFSDHYGE